MSVSIRLRRMGRKKQPHYRVVVTDTAHPRDGRFVETLGYYKPLSEPARIVLDIDRVDYWISQGALPSNTVNSLIKKVRRGGDDKVAVGEVDVEAERQKRTEMLAARRAAEKKAAQEAAAAAAAEAAAEAAAAEDTADAGEGEEEEGSGVAPADEEAVAAAAAEAAEAEASEEAEDPSDGADGEEE